MPRMADVVGNFPNFMPFCQHTKDQCQNNRWVIWIQICSFQTFLFKDGIIHICFVMLLLAYICFFNNFHERGSMAKIMGIYLGGKWREDGGKKWCRLLAASANKSRVGTLSHYRHFIRYRLQAKIDLRHFISGENAGLLYQHDQRSIFLVLVNEGKQVFWHRSGDTRD